MFRRSGSSVLMQGMIIPADDLAQLTGAFMTLEIINPEIFGFRPSGWNHGMLSPAGGRILFVAGQIVPVGDFVAQWDGVLGRDSTRDRKSTRLNSSHQIISYAVFC